MSASETDQSTVRLTLYFLGLPQVLLEGLPISGLRKAYKPLTLLAYLAVEADRPHHRLHLATLFWPDHSEKQALQNLRQTLSRLRRALKDEHAHPPHLLIDTHVIQFNRESNYWLDVDTFRNIMTSVHSHPHRRLAVCPSCVNHLIQAAHLYRGDFLSQIPSMGSLPFDEWLLLTREQLAYQARTVFRALAEAHLARKDLEKAHEYARRLCDMDPWNEASQRLMLRILAESEGRNAALAYYREFARRLAAELNVEPEDETQALIQRIRNEGTRRPASSPSTTPFSPSLPSPTTTFVGREEELAQLENWLASRARRFITIYGPGGIGKTRLVIQLARRQEAFWEHGVYFVSLTHARPQDDLADILANALHLPIASRRATADLLIDHLRTREVLLILDSFEFLQGFRKTPSYTRNVRLLADILRQAPGVKIIVTSRVRVGLQGEWGFRLKGLPVPSDISSLSAEDVHAFHGLQLFLERVQPFMTRVPLNEENVNAIVRICRAVGGLPLGIELAAAWTQYLSIPRIAEEIDHNLDFLKSTHPEAPKRHHSLRVTFDHSYALLTRSQRRLFRGLAVFQKGFTLEAAQHILNASLTDLLVLQDLSLIQQVGPERLDMHPTLHQYATEKWQQHIQEVTQDRERHAAYYMRLLAEQVPTLEGKSPQKALEILERERENVRMAWKWAASHQHKELLDQALGGLVLFYEMRGPFKEGEGMLQLAAEVVTDANVLKGRLYAGAARLLERSGDYLATREMAHRALELCAAEKDEVGCVTAHYALGNALWHLGNLADAQTHLKRARALAHRVHLPLIEVESLRALAGIAWRRRDYAQGRAHLEEALRLNVSTPHHVAALLHNLGVVTIEQGDYSEARKYYTRALALRKAIGDRQGIGMTLTNLGNFYLYLGQYEKAKQHYRQALQLLQEVGDRWSTSLVLGNLGLAYHYLGDDRLAEKYAHQAVHVAQAIGDKSTEATMWMELGHALAGQKRWREASEAYQRSWELQKEAGQKARALESVAGLARVALAQGHTEHALSLAKSILPHLNEHGLDGTIDPFLIHWTCYEVLHAVGDSRAGTETRPLSARASSSPY